MTLRTLALLICLSWLTPPAAGQNTKENADFKLAINLYNDKLYDLAADPGETKNLAASRPDLALSLSKYLEKAMSRAKKRASSGAAMSEDVREELKALGYIR